MVFDHIGFNVTDFLTCPLKHMELVALLKTEHELGHGHANALVAWFMSKK